MEKQYLFGKFEDNSKEKTMSFRVSKETHDLFEVYANAKWGNTSNALKEMFLEHMSQYSFRRQTLNFFTRVFIPTKGEFDIPDSPRMFISINNPSYTVSEIYLKDDLLDLRNVILSQKNVTDYRGLIDSEDEAIQEDIKESERWLEKKSGYHVDDGFFVDIPLNNHLDSNHEGIYCSGMRENYFQHTGLNILNYEGETYYLTYEFNHNPDDMFDPISFRYGITHDNQTAFKQSLACDNIELCKLIDSFNEGTSNIEKDKELLLDKKEKLLNQIEEIDDILSKF